MIKTAIKIFLLSVLSQLAAGSVVSLTAENYEATTAGKTVFIKVRNDERSIKSWPSFRSTCLTYTCFTSFVVRSSLLHGK
jgi:hypothetical protein